MVKGLTVDQFAFVLRSCNSFARLYIADLDLGTCTHPHGSDIAWPIHLLLGGFHPKHLFAYRTPSLGDVSRAIGRWNRSFSWKYVFSNNLIAGSTNVWRNIECKKPTINPCDVPMPAHIESWLQSSHQNIFDCCKQALFKHRLRRSRMPFCLSWALSVLKNGEWAACPSDKD